MAPGESLFLWVSHMTIATIDERQKVNSMLVLHDSGMTILKIADLYKVNAKTIYNLIKRHTDIDMALARKQRAERNKSKKFEQFHSREKHGFKWVEYRRLVKIGATKQFSKQRRQAQVRGIEWNFTFAQWWEVWRESGHYEDRGRFADQYVMARFGDIGPYAANNVEIITASANVKDLMVRQKRLGRINVQNLTSWKGEQA